MGEGVFSSPLFKRGRLKAWGVLALPFIRGDTWRSQVEGFSLVISTGTKWSGEIPNADFSDMLEVTD